MTEPEKKKRRSSSGTTSDVNNKMEREKKRASEYAFYICIFESLKKLEVDLRTFRSVPIGWYGDRFPWLKTKDGENFFEEVRDKVTKLKRLLSQSKKTVVTVKEFEETSNALFKMWFEELKTVTSVEKRLKCFIKCVALFSTRPGRVDELYEEEMVDNLFPEVESIVPKAMSTLQDEDLGMSTMRMSQAGSVIADVLTSNGMAVIRATEKSRGMICPPGDILKQTFCFAREAGGLERSGLEFVQDYGKSTSLDQHFSNEVRGHEAGKEVASRQRLRVLRLLQMKTKHCGHKNARGVPDCFCSKYEFNLNEVTCGQCKHLHREYKSYEDLLNIPCILILVDKARMGDTFPSSLRVMDLRLCHQDATDISLLTAFVQEIGRICRYTSLSDPAPYALISSQVENALWKSELHRRKGIDTYATYYSPFLPSKVDVRVKYNGEKGFLAKEGSVDFNNTAKYRSHILINAEPQIGKTSLYFTIIELIIMRIYGPQDEDFYRSSDEEDECDMELVQAAEKDAMERWEYPSRKALMNLPNVPAKAAPSKYDRTCGRYTYPCKKPPNYKRARATAKTTGHQKSTRHDYTTHGPVECFECIRTKATSCSSRTQKKIQFVDEPIHISVPDLAHTSALFREGFSWKPEGPVFIMSPSFGRADSARLQLRHLVGPNMTYVHFIFVRPNEYDWYVSLWGLSHIVVKIPETMSDIKGETIYNGGVGYARRFIQRFAHRLKIHEFYMADDLIVEIKKAQSYSENGKEYLKRDEENCLLMEPTSLDSVHKIISRIGTTAPLPEALLSQHPDCRVVKDVTGDREGYALVGFRKFRPALLKYKHPFVRAHISSFVYLNNRILMDNRVLYPPWVAR